MLFNGSNLTASANDLEWNNKKQSLPKASKSGKPTSSKPSIIKFVTSTSSTAPMWVGIKYEWHSNFESAYKTLTEKLRPKVYEYGFLK